MLSLSALNCMHVSIELAQAMAHLHPSAQPAGILGSICENLEFCEGGGDPTLGGGRRRLAAIQI